MDCTLALQSATRWVVSLAAWMPLSVKRTKLIYVGMMFFLQVVRKAVSGMKIKLTYGYRQGASNTVK